MILKINAKLISISGSFQIFVTKAGTNIKNQIWDGLSKGPPRKEKFPDTKLLVRSVLESIQD